MAEWAGVVATTITEYIRGETDEVMRNRKLLAIMQDRGNVTYNHSGKDVQWQPRYQRNTMQGFDDSDTLTFSRINRHKDAVLPWRGYSMQESMTERERLMNSGQEALVKLWSNKAKWMMEDTEDGLGDELYIDGNASGNSKRFHGLESFGAFSGTVSGSPAGSPHDNYAGLNTDLGSYGGFWGTAPWPTGSGAAQYDFYSPLIVDYSNALWPQATKTWDNTCIDALRYGLQKSRRNKSKKKQIDLVMLEGEMYRSFVQQYQAEERIQITPDKGSSGLYKLGFTDLQNFDGVDVTWEFGNLVDASGNGIGYGLPMDDIELMCLTPELINAKGPTFDEASQAWRFWLTILANLKHESIRNFCFWKKIS